MEWGDRGSERLGTPNWRHVEANNSEREEGSKHDQFRNRKHLEMSSNSRVVE